MSVERTAGRGVNHRGGGGGGGNGHSAVLVMGSSQHSSHASGTVYTDSHTRNGGRGTRNNGRGGGGTVSHHHHTLPEAPPDAAAKKPYRFTIHLLAIFGTLLILVVAAFSAMIVVSDVSSRNVATELAEKGASAQLHFAGARVSDVMLGVEEQLVEYRERFIAKRVSEEDPCGGGNASSPAINMTDGSPLPPKLSDGYGFFFDTSLVMRHNHAIGSFLYVRRDDTVNFSLPEWTPTAHPSYSSIRANITQCSASRSTLHYRTRNTTVTTKRLPIVNELSHLDGLDLAAPEEGLSVEHEDSFVQIALGVRGITWMPYIRINVDPTAAPTTAWQDGIPPAGEIDDNLVSTQIFFVATAPVSYIVTDIATGTSTPLLHHNDDLGERLDNHNLPANRIDIMATIAIKTPMGDFFQLMRTITPAIDGAHSSLYDLTDRLLLATSALSENEAVHRRSEEERIKWNVNYGQFGAEEDRSSRWWLFHSRETPLAALNEAYAASGAEELRPGDVVVDFGPESRDVVISAYVFDTPKTGNKFGVIQSTPKKYYFDQLDESQRSLIILGVCCAVAVVVVCVSIFLCIRLGLVNLLHNMKLAAAMKNHKVQPVNSVLREIDLLARGFASMNDQLLAARPFLPQHMLLTTSSDDDDLKCTDDGDSGGDDDEGAIGGGGEGTGTITYSDATSRATGTSKTSATKRNIAKNSKGGGGGGGRRGGANGRRRVSGENAKGGNSNNHHQAIGMPSLCTTVGLSAMTSDGSLIVVKRVTVLAMNVRGFHAYVVNASVPSSVDTPVSTLTSAIASIAAAHKGVVDSFHGDRFVISFNAVRNNAEGPSKAARAALKIIRKCSQALEIIAAEGRGRGGGRGGPARRVSDSNNTKNEIDPRIDLALGIATGRASVGSLGCDKMKRFSIIGPVYSKATALQRMASAIPSVPSLPIPSNAAAVGCNGGIIAPSSQQTFSASHATSPLRIQCLVDRPMAVELQSSFLLQVLGGLYGSPFPAPPAAARAESLGFFAHSVNSNNNNTIVNNNNNTQNITSASPAFTHTMSGSESHIFNNNNNNNTTSGREGAASTLPRPFHSDSGRDGVRTPSQKDGNDTSTSTCNVSIGAANADNATTTSIHNKRPVEYTNAKINTLLKSPPPRPLGGPLDSPPEGHQHNKHNHHHHRHNGNTTAAAGGPPPEPFYALHSLLADNGSDDSEGDADDKAGDEWLYELENAGGKGSLSKMAGDINTALLHYLSSLHHAPAVLKDSSVLDGSSSHNFVKHENNKKGGLHPQAPSTTIATTTASHWSHTNSNNMTISTNHQHQQGQTESNATFNINQQHQPQQLPPPESAAIAHLRAELLLLLFRASGVSLEGAGRYPPPADAHPRTYALTTTSHLFQQAQNGGASFASPSLILPPGAHMAPTPKTATHNSTLLTAEHAHQQKQYASRGACNDKCLCGHNAQRLIDALSDRQLAFLFQYAFSVFAPPSQIHQNAVGIGAAEPLHSPLLPSLPIGCFLASN